MRLSSALVLATAFALSAAGGCGGNKGGYTLYNTPPSATISTPANGTAFLQYEVVTFSGRIGDDQDDATTLSVTWTSSIDGELPGPLPADVDGYIAYSTANLSAGNHVITLQVVDSEGESSRAEAQVTITDLPEAPEITLIRPTSGESGLEGESFEFKIEAVDSKDEETELLVSFESDLDGVFCTPTPEMDGLATCTQGLSVGDHLLTFSATDTDGNVGQATAYFSIVARTAYDDDGDGWSEVQGDCDDADADVHPGAAEEQNAEDDDCDDLVDEGTAAYDDDEDGWSEATGDCDDADATVYPGAPETFDGDDEDCDELVDEGTSGYDDDLDGFTEAGGDCDDGYALSYPGATELADGRDNDCNGIEDDGTELFDDDGDGYSEAAGDCNDDNDDIHPGATETCGDGADNDCNSAADEAGAYGCTTYYMDYDGDAYGTSSSSACLCSASGYYTSRYSSDCYDYNSSANPSATSWFTSHRGDGSYDFNCDSAQTQYYTATGDCDWNLWSCDTTTGWSGSVRSCGTSGAYVNSCSTCGTLDTDCCENTSTVVQPCH